MYRDKISQASLSTPASFIRGILKATASEDTISFAGGLPNPVSFPKEEIEESTVRVINKFGSKVFQYAQTAGLPKLREYIANRLNSTQGMDVKADEILITNGSQQALDLIGKVLIDKGDSIVIESPGYLGAIQAFSQYQPNFCPVTLEEDGINIEELEKKLCENNVKFMYIVPNFQNPTGISYSMEKRKEVYRLVREHNCILVEDDPYGELKFDGNPYGYISKEDFSGSILLGSFSKIVTPGMRMGYMIVRDEELRFRINTAKEAADLHSNIFSQYILTDYLENNDIECHISKIRSLYKSQCDSMIEAIKDFLPAEVRYTTPEGGMFIWATLPDGASTLKLFEKTSAQNVVFVPGDPFYTDGRSSSSMRLNYTNSSKEVIREGMSRLGKLI